MAWGIYTVLTNFQLKKPERTLLHFSFCGLVWTALDSPAPPPLRPSGWDLSVTQKLSQTMRGFSLRVFKNGISKISKTPDSWGSQDSNVFWDLHIPPSSTLSECSWHKKRLKFFRPGALSIRV
jgi:hypothetical protein